MSIFRSPKNPVIEPKDIKPSGGDFEVIGAFNAGVARFRGEVILLVRVAERPISTHPDIVLSGVYDTAERKIVLKEFSKDDGETDFSDPRLIITPSETYLTSISHLRLARSKNGIDFEIDDRPTMVPANDVESFGIEDARISVVGGVFYITYVAVSPFGVTTCLASTEDFNSFERYGVIFCPDNKDALLFPERIGGKYYALHRPVSSLFKKNEIWIAESPDLKFWGNHRCLMGPQKGLWDGVKIGASAVPFKVSEGWVEIYHGVDEENRYCLGAVLLDGEKPWKVVARSKKPLFEPETDYECEGFFGNVVFSCGALFENGKVGIYYGAADTTVCYAEMPIEDVLENLGV